MKDIFQEIHEYINNNSLDAEPLDGSQLVEPGLLTTDQIEAVLQALGTARGSEGTFTLDEGTRAIRWAEGAILQATLLDLICKGFVVIDFKEGEEGPVFSSNKEIS